ncbi:MAG: tRNA uridine-5-carboxymethylaminomethyl(34) synthesis GTPase MnmE, partial [Candidatus Mariimomonas ferrooxydans]
AGIRQVTNMAEKEGVKRSLRAIRDADLVLIVLDGNEDLHDTDRELIKKSKRENTILVINKTDLAQKIRLKESDRQTVRVSALKGTGLNELKERIFETTLKGKSLFSTGVVTNTRHLYALEKALVSINSFIEESTKKISPEFLSLELRDALDAIGEIIGITTSEDILNEVFSKFCIGK